MSSCGGKGNFENKKVSSHNVATTGKATTSPAMKYLLNLFIYLP